MSERSDESQLKALIDFSNALDKASDDLIIHMNAWKKVIEVESEKVAKSGLSDSVCMTILEAAIAKIQEAAK